MTEWTNIPLTKSKLHFFNVTYAANIFVAESFYVGLQ